MFSRRWWVFYLSDVATSVNGETEDHLISGDLWSAVRVIQVQRVAVIAERVQVTPINHNVHVVWRTVHSTLSRHKIFSTTWISIIFLATLGRLVRQAVHLLWSRNISTTIKRTAIIILYRHSVSPEDETYWQPPDFSCSYQVDICGFDWKCLDIYWMECNEIGYRHSCPHQDDLY